MQSVRKLVQAVWIFLVNGFWGFPLTGNLYQGPLKVICSPGLNCYSCPAATTYCPIGSLQQLLLGVRFSLQSGQYYVGTYVLGGMGLLAAGFGRFICGWACPFGFMQELLYKIPTRKYSIPAALNWCKYGFFLVFVVILPLLLVDQFGMGTPWFCKYICPAGTMEAGIPMVLLVPDLRTTIGFLYLNKIVILIGVIIWSVLASRPFCRTICPLGAFYALFNRVSLIKLDLDKEACTNCRACHKVCPVEIHFNETPGNGECINCMKCMTDACDFDAIFINVAGYRLGQSGKNRAVSSHQ